MISFIVGLVAAAAAAAATAAAAGASSQIAVAEEGALNSTTKTVS